MAVAYEASLGGVPVNQNPSSPEECADTIALTSANLVVLHVEAYDDGSDTWVFNGAELGDGGSNWESMTEITSASFREDFGTDADYGTSYYLENPTLSYDTIRVSFTGTPGLGTSGHNFSYAACAVTGANVGGTEAALFPTTINTGYQASGSATKTLTMSGGSSGDMGLAMHCGYDAGTNDADVTVSTGATQRELGNETGFDTVWGVGTNDYANDSDIDITIGESYSWALYHIAQSSGSGPVITDVNTTESWTDGDTGLVITGTGFV